LVSQPFAGFPSQFANPAKQAVMTHCPFTHPGTAFGAVHTTPQPPQLATFEFVSTQTPLQSVVPAGQPQFPTPSQTPFEHGVPTGLGAQKGIPPEQPAIEHSPHVGRFESSGTNVHIPFRHAAR
jgi:hypothetical protein